MCKKIFIHKYQLIIEMTTVKNHQRKSWKQSENWLQIIPSHLPSILNRFDVESIRFTEVESLWCDARNGKRETVKVKQKKTKNYTIDIPLSAHSKKSIIKFLSDRDSDELFLQVKESATQEAISLCNIKESLKAGWECRWRVLYQLTNEKDTESYLFRQVMLKKKTLGHQSVTATSSYLNVSNDILLYTVQHHI